jgi:lambda repressor-like predicted transcriptional regulator
MTRRLLELALTDEIRAELARQHRTIVQLAAQTGIPLRTLKRRLSGSDELRTGELDVIAAALDIEVGTLNTRAHAALEAAMRRHPAGSQVAG